MLIARKWSEEVARLTAQNGLHTLDDNVKGMVLEVKSGNAILMHVSDCKNAIAIKKSHACVYYMKKNMNQVVDAV